MVLLALLPLCHAGVEARVDEMLTAWRGLSGYRTEQTVQERVGGELGTEQRMRVSFRKPWEIQLEWLTVHEGRKVYWCACQNDDKVLVDPGGMIGSAIGLLSFHPENGLLRRDTNYRLSQAGFGFLVEKLAGVFPAGRDAGALLRDAGEEAIAGVQTRHLVIGVVPGLPYGGADLWIDTRTHLPVRFSARNPAGELAERFTWGAVTVDPPFVDTVDFSLAYRD